MPPIAHSDLDQVGQELRITQGALEGSLAAVAVWELDGGVTYVNPAFLAMWNYKHPRDVRGKALVDLFDHAQASELKRVAEGKARWAGRLLAKRQDGSTFPVLLTASAIDEVGAGPTRGVATALDLAHIEQLARDALEQDERLTTLHEVEQGILSAKSSEEIALIALNHVCRVTRCQRAGVAVFDLENERASLLATFSEGTAPVEAGATWSLAGFRDMVRTLSAGAIFVVEDVRRRSLPGDIKRSVADCPPWSYAILPLRSADNLIGSLSLTMEGASEFAHSPDPAILQMADAVAVALQNARLLESAKNQAARLQHLAGRLRDSEEAERRRLARDLHDCVGESLTALGVNLNLVQAEVDPETSPTVHGRLEASLQLVAQTAERVRRVICDLRPPLLDEYGLLPALRRCAEDLGLRTSIQGSGRGDCLSPRAPRQVEDALFRIGQEALHNVAKHAGATRVTVELSETDEGIQLVVGDNGCGFDPQWRPPAGASQSYGLTTMAERAEAAGGRCYVKSNPGRGTRVIAVIPR